MAGRLDSACGSGSSGERWAFARLSHELTVVRAGRLEYVERYRVDPRERPVASAWIAGSAGYIGTVLLTGRPVEASVIAGLHEDLTRLPGVRAAADRLENQLCLVRLTAESGAQFRDARERAARALGAIRRAL
jgi:urease accessory protein UreH